MRDAKRMLEHARDGFAPPSDVMEALVRRRDRKRRRERIAAGGVAIAVCAVAALLLRSFVATPTQPAISPSITPPEPGLVSGIGEGRIVFVILRGATSQIAVIDGDELQLIGEAPEGGIFHATWASPTEVIYDDEVEGVRHLFRLSLDSGDSVQLTDGPASQEKAAVSPDGTQMVFDNVDPDDGRDLGMQIANIDGSGQRALLPPSSVGSSAGSSDAQFSPDGEWIAFTQFANSLTQESAIFVVRTDGTDLRRLTSDELTGRRPRWSPDGSTILFERFGPGPAGAPLWTVPFEGGEPTQLTGHGGDEAAFEADWSPSGSQIVFKYWNPAMGNNELRIVDADGSNERILWAGRANETAETPDWGP